MQIMYTNEYNNVEMYIIDTNYLSNAQLYLGYLTAFTRMAPPSVQGQYFLFAWKWKPTKVPSPY